jgi:hypothetical protein
MTMRYFLSAAFIALPLASSMAFAKTTTRFLDNGKDGFSVGFEDPSCGGECYEGALSCNRDGTNVEFEFGLVEPSDAVIVVSNENRSFTLTAGKVSTTFNATELHFVEMTGAWVMSGPSFEDTDKLLAAMAKAKTFTAVAGKGKTDLPVTSDVKTWIKRCGG